MTTKPSGESPSRWEWPKSSPECRPVMGTSELFITEESAAQVANKFGSFDVDEHRKAREIKSEPPVEEQSDKWTGVSTSDP